jgi:hypothetical protein
MRKGNKIICIKISQRSRRPNLITIGKVYTIVSSGELNDYFYCSIVNDSGELFGYDSSCFISLKEYRKQKLEKINGIKDR